MEIFNSFYYSWSPNIADNIRAHEGVGALLRPVLYPLIGALQVSEGVFGLLSVTPELAIVTTGIVASGMLAFIYLVPLALAISYYRNYSPSLMLIQAVGILWLASVSAIVIAEISHSSPLMMTATGILVLTMMGVTILFSLKVVPVYLRKGYQYALSRLH